ncbi:hypothetical protein Hanom_Chr03g00208911 [Helianthus anomalus]
MLIRKVIRQLIQMRWILKLKWLQFQLSMFGVEGLERSEVTEKRLEEEIYKTLEKKKKRTVEEIVIESKLVDEVKKVDEKIEEVVARKSQKDEEDHMAEEVMVPNVEVKNESEFSKMLDKSDHKTDEQCKKCMETCKVCTEKDNSIRSKEIEFTKIEKNFKEKYNEMFENKVFETRK